MIKKNHILGQVRTNWAGNRSVQGRYVNIRRKNSALKSINNWNIPLFKERSIINYGKRWEPDTVLLHNTKELEDNTLVWLGHSTFVLTLAGKKIIFDPVFWNIPFVQRKSRLPISPHKITDIDLLLLSHDHYDHADKRSVKTLARCNPHLEIIAGLGFGPLLHKWAPHAKINEIGWYQQIEFGDLKITFLPSHHWGKRSALDSAKRLWGAFMIEGNGIKIYFSGDTGFAEHFQEVQDIFGDVDYTIIGIGAYKPRWFLERNHISPYEALRAAKIMGSKVTIPMHYGTFKLSQEPMFDPPIVFEAEARRVGVPVLIPNIGEVVVLSTSNNIISK